MFRKYILGFAATVLLVYYQSASTTAFSTEEHGHNHANEKSHIEHSDDHGHNEHDDHDGEHSAIFLDQEAQEMIGLSTVVVQKENLKNRIKVYGKIAKDTGSYSYINFNGEGTVESINAGLGKIVDKGDSLVIVRNSNGELETVKSPIHGTILSVFVNPKDTVDRLTTLMSIVDMDIMKASIDIYEKDLRFVEPGQKVILKTAAYPDKTFDGKVVYISPQIDEHTQSIKVRVDIDNSEHLLRLGMFVSGELIYSSGEKVPTIPSSAVQEIDGENIVFIKEGKEEFELREVILGVKTDMLYEVKSGLKEGDVVVAQGSFYLKSEKAKSAFGDGHAH